MCVYGVYTHAPHLNYEQKVNDDQTFEESLKKPKEGFQN